MENAVLVLWDSWGILGRVVAFLALAIFVLGMENLAIKLVADIQGWRRRRSEPTLDMLRRKQEDRAAILIPITGPAPLAGAMLARIKRTIEYENYTIFVGVRATDTQLIAAVRREARADSRVQLCLYEGREAGTQGRALNALLAAVREFELRHDDDFRTYLLQGAESIPHPLSLKLVNWHCEFASIVQLPVLTVPRGRLSMAGGAGLDDLGEHNAREMQLRAQMIQSVPARGSGLALRRDAVWALRLHGDVFDPGSDSPAFDAVRRLGERGHLASFVWQRDENRAVIAIEELSPRDLREAVRAKAERLSATALAGWQPLGNAQGSAWTHYFNYRDRRIVIVAATIACTVVTGLAAIALLFAGHMTPGFESMPPLVDSPWVLTLLAVDAALLGAALIDRVVLTARTRGLAAAAFLPLAMVASGLITARAVLIASRRSSSPDSTSRAAPLVGAAIAARTRITDILVHSGAMTADEAKLARAYARRSGRQLALAVQDLRLADGVQVARALGEKLGLEFGHLDGPLDSYSAVFLGRHEAERFCAFAQRAEDGGVDVYVGEEYRPREWRALRAALRRAGVHRPTFRTAPLGEIAYAIRFAGTAQEMAVEQAIAVSLMDGPIPEGTASDIRRQLRAPYRRLEDLLVERGLIRPRRLRLARRRIGLDARDLQEAVCKDRRIPPFTLAETVREFNAWRPAIAPLTSVAPMDRYRVRTVPPIDPRWAA